MTTYDTGLTRREWYVALLHAHGAYPNEAASSLGVSAPAVERLLDTARAKLGAQSRSQIRRAIPAPRAY
jgi:DNA-binding CsgD family transcriptional regulator